jgi:hypothetical protein
MSPLSKSAIKALYHNDGLPDNHVHYCQISAREMLRIAQGVRPILQGSKARVMLANLSFSVIRQNATSTIGFDFLIPDALLVPFYRAAVAGLDGNQQEGRKAICHQAANVAPEKIEGCR